MFCLIIYSTQNDVLVIISLTCCTLYISSVETVRTVPCAYSLNLQKLTYKQTMT